MAEQPVSLYLDLEAGRSADIEAVSRAALAWAAALREISLHYDPLSEVRIELVSGTPGSLSLNAVLKTVRNTVTDKNNVRAAVAFAAIWLIDKAGSYAFDEVMDWLRGEDAAAITVGLSDEQINELANEVAEKLKAKIAPEPVKRLYREIDRDEAIKGVGATTVPGKRPKLLTSRRDFADFIERDVAEDNSAPKRTISLETRVVVIRPVLVDEKRVWRFRSLRGEFSAILQDAEFVRRLLLGEIPIRMRAGIELDVEMVIEQELSNGVWEDKKAIITKVRDYHEPSMPTTQTDLLPPSDGQP